MIRTPEELDDSDFEIKDFDVRIRMSIQTEDDKLIAGQSAQAIMAQLPREQKGKTVEQMCMIMMEMTGFTRGKGLLKNMSDVIRAAKKIAGAGSRMDKLGCTIVDHFPNLACKQYLLAYSATHRPLLPPA
ncbi:Catenin alpha-1 [Plecturocebus cupreus]